MAEENVLDVVGMKAATEVSEEDLDNIANLAKKEIAEERGEKKENTEEEDKPVKKEPKKEDEPKDEKTQEQRDAEKKSKEEEKAKAKEEKQKAEDERILNAKDEELSEEEKPRKAELVKIKEENDKKAEEEYVKSFAERKKLTPEKAKEEIAHIKAIKEKYKDPDEMSYAYLNAQRAMTKAQEEAKAEREYKPVRNIEKMSTEEIVENYLDSGRYKINGVAATRDQIIDMYRERHAEITENLEDDKVTVLIANDIRNHMVLNAKQSISERKVQAKDVRDKVIADLSENDKKYSEEIRSVLNNMSDNMVLAEGFSPSDILAWTKGKRVEEIESTHASEVKKAYDEGFKKGQEAGKILGTKGEGARSGGNPPKKTVTLSEEQKEEALSMFQTDSMTEEEKYAAYKDVVKDRPKEKGE